uniref:hypothetical protein 23 n=1 Tax=Moniliophthora perniciosa TaxID=153609 RepID=UPI0000242362|nr:hypothetical protein 23 [Moniliophthora perniciosa]AAQ74313.1 hypothetical protein 23 [Moniliophthora perniciosa]
MTAERTECFLLLNSGRCWLYRPVSSCFLNLRISSYWYLLLVPLTTLIFFFSNRKEILAASYPLLSSLPPCFLFPFFFSSCGAFPCSYLIRTAAELRIRARRSMQEEAGSRERAAWYSQKKQGAATEGKHPSLPFLAPSLATNKKGIRSIKGWFLAPS